MNRFLSLLCFAIATNLPVDFASAAGNGVEPISNGLSLEWSSDEIRQRFGEPASRMTRCEMNYGAFQIEKCYGPDSSRLYLYDGSVRLSSGIGVGSSRNEVARVFNNPVGATVGPYKLEFRYAGDRVSRIRVDYERAAAKAAGSAATNRAINNFYSNQQTLQNHMDRNGTIGWNPHRN